MNLSEHQLKMRLKNLKAPIRSKTDYENGLRYKKKRERNNSLDRLRQAQIKNVDLSIQTKQFTLNGKAKDE